MDFVMDALACGRRIKCLTIVDDFTKECLDIPVANGISGDQVARTLDAIAAFRGYPQAVRTDQGPEFTSKALDQWANENRPHSALSYQTPLEFAAGYRTTEKGSKLTDI